VEAELVLEPGQTNQPIIVLGVPDLLDDGPQQFAISVGPCSSNDARFKFDWVHARVAFGWNEDHAFPIVEEIEPTQSALLGESVTIRGRYLNQETSVCVNGTYVSGPPDYRVSLTIVLPSGVATAFEVTLQSPAALQWFQNVSGTEHRPYARRACPQLGVRRRPSARAIGISSAVNGFAAAVAEGPTGAAATSKAAANGIDMKSIQYGVINTTQCPTADASSLPNDIADATALRVQGTLAVDDLVFNITVVSYIPTEPFLDQARNVAAPPIHKVFIDAGYMDAGQSRFAERKFGCVVAREPGHTGQLLGQ
jgi:hypothetical protein